MRVGNKSKSFELRNRQFDVKPNGGVASESKQEMRPAPQQVNSTAAKTPFEPSMESSLQRAKISNLFHFSVHGIPFAVPAQVRTALPAVGLKTPKPEVVEKLGQELKIARAAAESGDEKDRKAVDAVLKKVADAYGIGLTSVSGLEFDPRLEEQGGTIGTPGKPRTFIVIGKSALESPAVLASTILHESSHVQRNQQLADAGINRDNLGPRAETVWSSLIEVEGYQNEIDNAKKLGTSEAYVKGARNLREGYLRELEAAGGKEWRELAEKDKFKELHQKFVQQYRTK